MPRTPYVGPERRQSTGEADARARLGRHLRNLVALILAMATVAVWWPVGRRLIMNGGPGVSVVGTTRCTPLGAAIWLRTGEYDDEHSVTLAGLHEAVHASQCLRLGVFGSDRNYNTPAGMLSQEVEAYARSMRGLGYSVEQCVSDTTENLDPSIYTLLRRLPADSIARTIRRWCAIRPGGPAPV